jgi:hypothetical protein
MELVGGNPAVLDNPGWVDAVEKDEAQARLTKVFYKFKDIDWVPFERAQEVARARKKPLFAVVALGTLDNQTC